MGARSGLYGQFYLFLAFMSALCMGWSWMLFLGGGKDCIYGCPLLTQNSTWLNEAKVNATCSDGDCRAYQTGDTIIPFAYCTSLKGICMKIPSASDPTMYGNACMDKDAIIALGLVDAYKYRCMYCDEMGMVYWPSIKVTAVTKWIPTSVCGEPYLNAGIDGLTPKHTQVKYGDGDGALMIDNTKMGAAFFMEQTQDMTGYPYCEGKFVMGWDTSAVDLMAPLAMMMLMLLCVYYSLMTFLCGMVGIVFLRFKKVEDSDWTKLKCCDNVCGCMGKKFQVILRIANTVSLVPILFMFYLIWGLGVCTNAVNEFGEKTFYPSVQYFCVVSLFSLFCNCIGGCWFRHKFPIETAFFNAQGTSPPKEKVTMGDKVMKKLSFCWQVYNHWGGP